jgi:hypothetical protein
MHINDFLIGNHKLKELVKFFFFYMTIMFGAIFKYVIESHTP